MKPTILHINSSARHNDSVTRENSLLLTQNLAKKYPQLHIKERDLSIGLPFIDEQWVAANFTPIENRTDSHRDKLSFSDNLVSELEQAEHIIIAVPIYNFSVPAVLKAWIDLVARASLTFKFTTQGSVGLLKNKKAYLVIASGGTQVGSEIDFATNYLKHVLGFIGITDVVVIDSSTINAETDDTKRKQIAAFL